MTKENLEIYQEVFPKSQLRRMKVVDTSVRDNELYLKAL